MYIAERRAVAGHGAADADLVRVLGVSHTFTVAHSRRRRRARAGGGGRGGEGEQGDEERAAHVRP